LIAFGPIAGAITVSPSTLEAPLSAEEVEEEDRNNDDGCISR
jgi:hypothetical protein